MHSMYEVFGPEVCNLKHTMLVAISPFFFLLQLGLLMLLDILADTVF